MARAYPRPSGRGITALAIDRQVSGIKKLRTEVRGTIKIEDFDVQLKPWVLVCIRPGAIF